MKNRSIAIISLALAVCMMAGCSASSSEVEESNTVSSGSQSFNALVKEDDDEESTGSSIDYTQGERYGTTIGDTSTLEWQYVYDGTYTLEDGSVDWDAYNIGNGLYGDSIEDTYVAYMPTLGANMKSNVLLQKFYSSTAYSEAMSILESLLGESYDGCVAGTWDEGYTVYVVATNTDIGITISYSFDDTEYHIVDGPNSIYVDGIGGTVYDIYLSPSQYKSLETAIIEKLGESEDVYVIDSYADGIASVHILGNDSNTITIDCYMGFTVYR